MLCRKHIDAEKQISITIEAEDDWRADEPVIEIVNCADKAVYYAKNADKNAVYLLDHGRAREDRVSDFVRIDF